MAGREKDCRWSVVCRDKFVAWVKGIGDGVWSVGTSLLRGSRGLLAECGLSGQVCCVGQEACWRRVVCRDKYGEWVKGIGDGVWSVGAKTSSGSKKLATGVVCRGENVAWVKGIVGGCGLSGQVWRVGQRNCLWRVVCRDKFVAWVKRPVGDVWSVGTSMASGSRELATACGLSGQVCCVGQENCRRRVVCRVKYGEWVKRPVGGCGLSGRKCCVGQRNCRRVWSVGSSLASGSRELSAGCGLSGRNRCVGQGASRRMWSVGAKRASGSRELLTGVVCRVEKGEWVKKPVAGVWSVGVKTASEPKKPHISYAPNVANRHSDQNCQNPQNMIHLL